MSSRPKEEDPTIVERLFRAVSQGEPDRVLELVHPQAEWSPTAWSGEELYRGHDGVRRWLSQFGEGIRQLDIRVQKVEASGNRGATQGIVFDTRGDRTFAVQAAWSFEVEDGLLRRGRAHGSWDEAVRAARLP